MKRIISVFLAVVLIAALAQTAFAQIEEKKEQLEKIRNYIKLLDWKIQKARAVKNAKKVAELQELKRKELVRAKELREEIARLEKAGPKPKPKAKVVKKSGFQIGAGYGGGAGIARIGYRLSFQQNINLVFDAGYGFGKEFYILVGGVSGVMPIGDNFIGLGLGVADYSETVKGVIGISGNVEKGSRFGIGVFAGRSFGGIEAQIGYDTALGLTAGAIYRF